MESFGEWLSEQLDERGWTQAELARRAYISQSTLNRIVNGMRQPGPDATQAIAKALGKPPAEVFRHAGLLPPVPERRRREFEEVAEQLAALPDGPIREQTMAAIRAIAADAMRRAMEEEKEKA